jgi:hypothetical protein
LLFLQVVSEACDPVSALDVAFDASYSKDPSNRGLTFTWSQSGINPLLQDLIDKANTAKASRLVITAANILMLPNADDTLQVTATNFLGAASSRSITFSKKGAGEAPTVSIVGGQQQDFKVAEGIRVSSQLLAKSVCAGKQVRCKTDSQQSCSLVRLLWLLEKVLHCCVFASDWLLACNSLAFVVRHSEYMYHQG